MSEKPCQPQPRRCPCGCYPVVTEYTGAPIGNRAQVSCACCGRATERHEAIPPNISCCGRAVAVWNELVNQHDQGAVWPGARHR